MEIVMSTGELKAYADTLGADMSESADFVRSALVLRMVAEGDTEGTRKYYRANPSNSSYISFMNSFCDALSNGANRMLSKRERAINMWEAFCLYKQARADFFAEVHRPLKYKGEPEDFSEVPIKNYLLSEFSFHWDYIPDELKGAKNNGNLAIENNAARFVPAQYYKYRAFETGFEAAELLDDGSELQAKMYILAANEIKVRNPEWADKAYKALARKCAKTELGYKAEKIKWFPHIDETPYKLLADLKGISRTRSGDLPPTAN
jgi:hypothetical protein